MQEETEMAASGGGGGDDESNISVSCEPEAASCSSDTSTVQSQLVIDDNGAETSNGVLENDLSVCRDDCQTLQRRVRAAIYSINTWRAAIDIISINLSIYLLLFRLQLEKCELQRAALIEMVRELSRHVPFGSRQITVPACLTEYLHELDAKASQPANGQHSPLGSGSS